MKSLIVIVLILNSVIGVAQITNDDSELIDLDQILNCLSVERLSRDSLWVEDTCDGNYFQGLNKKGKWEGPIFIAGVNNEAVINFHEGKQVGQIVRKTKDLYWSNVHYITEDSLIGVLVWRTGFDVEHFEYETELTFKGQAWGITNTNASSGSFVASFYTGEYKGVIFHSNKGGPNAIVVYKNDKCVFGALYDSKDHVFQRIGYGEFVDRIGKHGLYTFQWLSPKYFQFGELMFFNNQGGLTKYLTK